MTDNSETIRFTNSGINDVIQVGKVFGEVLLLKNSPLGEHVAKITLFVGASSKEKDSIQQEEWYVVGDTKVISAKTLIHNGMNIAVVGYRLTSIEEDCYRFYNIVNCIDLLTVKEDVEEGVFKLQEDLKAYDKLLK